MRPDALRQERPSEPWKFPVFLPVNGKFGNEFAEDSLHRQSYNTAAVGLCLVLVYVWCMARTNIDIDEKACASVMRRYRLKTKREAINFALRALAAEPLTVESARKLRGTGWSGDLDALRTDRVS